EQERFLGNDANQRSHHPQREFATVDAVEGNAAVGWIDRARDQLDQRALARARLAENGDRRPGRNVEIDRIQRRMLPVKYAGLAERYFPRSLQYPAAASVVRLKPMPRINFRRLVEEQL